MYVRESMAAKRRPWARTALTRSLRGGISRGWVRKSPARRPTGTSAWKNGQICRMSLRSWGALGSFGIWPGGQEGDSEGIGGPLPSRKTHPSSRESRPKASSRRDISSRILIMPFPREMTRRRSRRIAREQLIGRIQYGVAGGSEVYRGFR